MRRVGAVVLMLALAGCGSPALVGSSGPVTTLQVRDASDGTVRHEVDLQGAVAGEPVPAGDVVLVEVPEGIAAYGLPDGAQRWRAAGPSFPDAVAGGVVVLGDAGAVTARDAATGEVRWSRPTPGKVVQSLRGAVDRTDGEAVRRDPASGAELAGRVPSTYGVATGGDLLVGADDRVLTAVRGDRPAWTSPLPTGPNAITYLAVDARWVVSVTSTGQPPTRD